MTGVFSQILNMSLTASVVILLLLLLRLPFKQAPKVISYALWGIVLIRLLCPVSLPSPASLFSWTEAPAVEAGQAMSAISYLPTVYPTAEPEAAITAEADAAEPAPAPQSSEPDVREIAAWIWLAGALILAAWAAAAYFRLLLRLRSAVPLGSGSIWPSRSPRPLCWGFCGQGSTCPRICRKGSGTISSSTSGCTFAGATM